MRSLAAVALSTVVLVVLVLASTASPLPAALGPQQALDGSFAIYKTYVPLVACSQVVEPTPPPPSGNVQIIDIYYDGAEPTHEGDECAVIQNVGDSPVDIGGWRLNAGDVGQDFYFPAFTMQPNQVCRVYTDEYHPEWCGFNFGSDSALWANAGDCGYLYNSSGVLVSRYCYP